MKKIIFPNGHSALQLTILLVGLVIMFSACVAHKYSHKVRGESMSLKETNSPDLIRYAMMKPQHINDLASRSDKSRGILNPLPLISVAVDGIIQLVDSEKKKFTATYRNSGDQCFFYDQISEKDAFDPTGMQFNGFTFLRLLKDKKRNADTAVYARFSVDLKNPYEIINNSTFSLKLDELKIKYSKAKIMAKKWFEPWSWFMASKYPKLNMDFEIFITSSWVTSGGSIFDNIPIGKFYFTVRNIPMDKTDPTYKSFYESVKNIPVRGRSFLVPRSYGYYYNAVNQITPSYGQGIYNIVVNVTESSRSNFVSKLLYDNSTEFLKVIPAMIQPQKTTTTTKKTTK
jgi:hypothetical protein